MENQYNSDKIFNSLQQESLPNAKAVLILGIGSIIGFLCGGGIIGLIMSIIAVVLAKGDRALLRANPGHYTAESVSNLNTGRVAALIILWTSVVLILFAILIIVALGVSVFREALPFNF